MSKVLAICCEAAVARRAPPNLGRYLGLRQRLASWSGHALNVTGNQKAYLVLRKTALDGRINVPLDGPGSIRLWVASHWTSANLGGGGPGNVAVVWELGSWSKSQTTGWWSLSIDPAGNTLNFVGVINGQPTVLLSTPISWASGEWHQVTLSWDPQGQTQLFVDGVVAAQGAGMALAPLSTGSGTTAFSLGSDLSGNQRFHGLLEEVYTFGRALTLAEVDKDYERQIGLALLGPMSEAEEEAMLAVAGQNALSSPIQMMTGMSQFAAGSMKYGCRVWLELGRPNQQGKLPITIHNTQEGVAYTIWCKTGLDDPTWDEADTIAGQANSDFTTCELDINNLTELIFAVSYETTEETDGFDGLNYVETLADPPDTMGAVGLDYFVEVLNHTAEVWNFPTLAIYDKNNGGNGPVQLASLVDAFSLDPSTNTVIDIRILYDHLSDAWFFAGVHPQKQEILFAVKDNPDPRNFSSWNKHKIPTGLPAPKSTPFADYVTLGSDINGVYLTYLHRDDSNPVKVHTIHAFSKSEVFSSTFVPTPGITISNATGTQVWTIQPPVNFDEDPVDDFVWLVAKGPHQNSPPNFSGGPILYRRLQWQTGNFSMYDGAWKSLEGSPPDYQDYYDLEDNMDNPSDPYNFNAPHAGSSFPVLLNSPSSLIHGRLMNALIRNGYLWTCHTVGLDGSDGDYDGTVTDLRTGVQWFKLNINSGTGALEYSLHGRVFDACAVSPYEPEYYYVPSISVNSNGDMLIGCSGSSFHDYIGGFYFLRLANGSAPNQPLLLKRGEAIYPGGGWGDYSMTSLDPFDSTTFWTIQQYMRDEKPGSPSYNWGTWIGAVTP